jgi:cyclopropane fatty-acyl-phospholipid synthase-like methyltransferase
MDAMGQARRRSVATLVDLSNDAFAYGRAQAEREGLRDRVHFIEGDVRDVERMLDRPPDIVKMLGICEYLSDAQICAIVRATADVMPAGAWIVLNSLSPAHGNDRFFRRVFGLHMIHRTPRELRDLVEPAGFGEFVTLREPLGVYHVLVGRRAAAGDDGEGTE